MKYCKIILMCFFTIVGIAGENPKEEDEVASLYADFKADAIHAEGLVHHVYLDSEGYKTAGIGHRLVGDELKMEVGVRVYDEQIDEWFSKDFSRVLMSMAKHFPEFHTYPRLVELAMCNWIFQLGPDAPEKFPRATEAIRARKWAEAADEWEYADRKMLRKSKWHLQTPSRCEQEADRLRQVAKEGLVHEIHHPAKSK